MIDSDVEGFEAALLLEKGMSANTCAGYSSDIAFFVDFLKRRGIVESSAVTRADIVDFLAEEREKGMKGSTRCRRTAAIRMFFRYLKGRRLIKVNPSDLMDTPKKAQPLPKILSEEEVSAMLEEVKDIDPRSLRDRAMLEVLYGCGLRVSELCGAKTDDIVADGELLRVFGKGSKERLVPIGSAAGTALTRYFETGREFFTRGNASETHMFVTRLGRPFTRQGVFKIIKERAAAVGIAAERISPHVLRHCFASHMLAHGADVRSIQEMLGHADVGTTQIYTHVDTTRFGDLHRRFHPRA